MFLHVKRIGGLIGKVTSSFCTSKNATQIYTYPYNVNREQQKSYLQNVQRQIASTQAAQINPIPRRKRRLYQKPKHDENIQKYGAWRVFGDQRMTIFGEETIPMSFKIMLKPKDLVHTFGHQHIADVFDKSASGEYWFEDNNLSQYLLVDWRVTTCYKPNDPYWDYEYQDHIEPRKRKILRLEPNQFWASDIPSQFRVYGSKYSQFHKFKKWIQYMINERQNKQSYDQQIDKKFGKVHCYNSPQQQVTIYPAAVEHLTKQMFQVKTQLKDSKKKNQKQKEKSKVVQAPQIISTPSQKYRLPIKPEESFKVNEEITVFIKQEMDLEQQQKKNNANNKNIKAK